MSVDIKFKYRKLSESLIQNIIYERNSINEVSGGSDEFILNICDYVCSFVTFSTKQNKLSTFCLRDDYAKDSVKFTEFIDEHRKDIVIVVYTNYVTSEFYCTDKATTLQINTLLSKSLITNKDIITVAEMCASENTDKLLGVYKGNYNHLIRYKTVKLNKALIDKIQKNTKSNIDSNINYLYSDTLKREAVSKCTIYYKEDNNKSFVFMYPNCYIAHNYNNRITDWNLDNIDYIVYTDYYNFEFYCTNSAITDKLNKLITEYGQLVTSVDGFSFI